MDSASERGSDWALPQADPRQLTQLEHHPIPQPGPPILEIPIFGRSSLLPAINAGARRIELNAEGSYAVGGTTPSLGLVRQAVADMDGLDISVPLRVMIRPRRGDFCYSVEERHLIRTAIKELKGVLREDKGDGFVFGALIRRPGIEGLTVDQDLCREVTGLCFPFPVVFHRAFDEMIGTGDGPRVEEELGLISRLGFKTLLTSGGVGNAKDNLAVLKRIIEYTADDPMEIVVGGGVRSENVRTIYDELRKIEFGMVVYHSSCLMDPENSEKVSEEEVRGIIKVWGADV